MNKPPFDPESAISAARTGDANAVARLIEHYRPYLRMLANAAAPRNLRAKLDESDVVQDACLQATKDLADFRGHTEAELAAWLRSILANVVANARRHYEGQKRNVDLEHQLRSGLDESSAGLARIADAESSPSVKAIRRERAVILAEALDQLSPEYRSVVQMRDLQGLSLEEIAKQTGKSRNAVQKMWARAITELRQILNNMP